VLSNDLGAVGASCSTLLGHYDGSGLAKTIRASKRPGRPISLECVGKRTRRSELSTRRAKVTHSLLGARTGFDTWVAATIAAVYFEGCR